MRTNVDIDDKLMKAAMKATGKKTKIAISSLSKSISGCGCIGADLQSTG